jgi:hypothetical protein
VGKRSMGSSTWQKAIWQSVIKEKLEGEEAEE